MISIEAASANELFSAAAHTVMSEGSPVAPRGGATREVLGAHLLLRDPRRRLISAPPIRILNPAFAVAEAVWILSGSDDAWIFDYNRRLAEFADDGVLRGAYGPRLRRWRGVIDQLDRVRHLLLEDPDTRRAVIQLYDPGLDSAPNKDVPCTLGFRFFLRDGRLRMHTTMRSQDLWLGFCYDVFTFSVLHELMAHWVGAELGEYHHHVDSLHLYAEHWDAALRLPTAPAPSPRSAPLAVAWEDLDTTLARTRTGGPPLPAAWDQFAWTMHSYRLWKAGNHGEARNLALAIPGALGADLTTWYDHLTRRRNERRNGVDTPTPGARPVLGHS
ncbi:thymidylate synthase [Nocardiopsis lucentensis]|uniref:thymidylate synthase n=1 Tax=Nocardiopsis lucentensis TaxID=53441 RepID=UPI000348E977|nr:thymidylate synthase [Nocardiopsis lucentensis]